ncbi:hypothetical protein DNTS_009842 [Danionella cerebrum]|uniref:Uncharacterized protein n=1 Tax=Danionella cerebrum TaxID=2873325 RepID=A0A553ML48_9TELE|nr:hypothetical protein DNTS_009842 [Danionella translucida]
MLSSRSRLPPMLKGPAAEFRYQLALQQIQAASDVKSLARSRSACSLLVLLVVPDSVGSSPAFSPPD